jgi:acetylglutamate kinase
VRILVKLGGTLLDAADSRSRLAGEIGELASAGAQVAVVHGGGKQMTRFLAERGVESRFVNGLRVSSPEVIDALLNVLAGKVNHELVAAFTANGTRAVGLSGLDASLAVAEQMSPELGAVGRITRANGGLLDLLASNGYVPVVACIAGGLNGEVFNVNADQMAAGVAAAFGADKLFFLTDVDGVRDQTGATAMRLTPPDIRCLIDSGIATGGMQAKLESAQAALAGGVREIVIAPGHRQGVVAELASGAAAGTRIVHEGAAGV